MKEANNSFDKGTRDHDKLSFGVFRTPKNNDPIVERSLVADLGKKLEAITQGRKFISQGRYLLIDSLL